MKTNVIKSGKKDAGSGTLSRNILRRVEFQRSKLYIGPPGPIPSSYIPIVVRNGRNISAVHFPYFSYI